MVEALEAVVILEAPASEVELFVLGVELSAIVAEVLDIVQTLSSG